MVSLSKNTAIFQLPVANLATILDIETRYLVNWTRIVNFPHLLFNRFTSLRDFKLYRY